MGFRQIFGGSTAPKHFTDVVPSNIWGLHTLKIFDGCGSVKCLGAVDPKIFHGWGFVRYLGAVDPKNISSVKYLGGVDPQKI